MAGPRLVTICALVVLLAACAADRTASHQSAPPPEEAPASAPPAAARPAPTPPAPPSAAPMPAASSPGTIQLAGNAVADEAAPAEAPPAASPTGLADVSLLDPSIIVTLRNATPDNITGRPLPGYEANRAFLQPPAAEALARVQRRLAPQGLSLKIYDAYRPLSATRALVDWAYSIGRGDLVGPYIASLSYHNSGQAVDLTIVDVASGRELDMGTAVDDLTPAANTANASGIPARNRAILVEAMQAEGFENYEGEWWHFNYFVPGAVPLDEPIR